MTTHWVAKVVQTGLRVCGDGFLEVPGIDLSSSAIRPHVRLPLMIDSYQATKFLTAVYFTYKSTTTYKKILLLRGSFTQRRWPQHPARIQQGQLRQSTTILPSGTLPHTPPTGYSRQYANLHPPRPPCTRRPQPLIGEPAAPRPGSHSSRLSSVYHSPRKFPIS